MLACGAASTQPYPSGCISLAIGASFFRQRFQQWCIYEKDAVLFNREEVVPYRAASLFVDRNAR